MQRQNDGAIRPLYQPRPVQVLATPAGTPRLFARRGRDAGVSDVLDVWRIDDEWWRDEIARRYFMLLLCDGTEASVFQDLVTGQWFEQHY